MPDPKKGKPDFSDVRGGGSSTERASQPRAGQQYTVEKGDSLSKIAKREYGRAEDWRKIYEANRDIIKDPDLIHPGQ
jgi:nucleoid-associated protein YgaU